MPRFAQHDTLKPVSLSNIVLTETYDTGRESGGPKNDGRMKSFVRAQRFEYAGWTGPRKFWQDRKVMSPNFMSYRPGSLGEWKVEKALR
jgi:hypothetical protein